MFLLDHLHSSISCLKKNKKIKKIKEYIYIYLYIYIYIILYLKDNFVYFLDFSRLYYMETIYFKHKCDQIEFHLNQSIINNNNF